MRSLLFPFLLLAMCVGLVAGCRSQDPEIFVSNSAAEEIISLSKARDQGVVSRLHLHIEGKLEGSARLLVMREGRPFHSETLSGTIDIKWTAPWSDDRVRLHYLPAANTSGSVRIRYRFSES